MMSVKFKGQQIVKPGAYSNVIVNSGSASAWQRSLYTTPRVYHVISSYFLSRFIIEVVESSIGGHHVQMYRDGRLNSGDLKNFISAIVNLEIWRP